MPRSRCDASQKKLVRSVLGNESRRDDREASINQAFFNGRRDVLRHRCWHAVFVHQRTDEAASTPRGEGGVFAISAVFERIGVKSFDASHRKQLTQFLALLAQPAKRPRRTDMPRLLQDSLREIKDIGYGWGRIRERSVDEERDDSGKLFG